MVSEKEVEAAREAWREYWSDVISQHDDNKSPMEGMRRALEAAARVRAEANAGEPVAWPKIMYVCENCLECNPEMCGYDRRDIYVTPDGRWLCDSCIDGEGISSRDCTTPPMLYAHPAPQPSVKVKPLEWVASDDWEYRWTADLYAIEDQGKNWPTDRYWLYYNGQRLGKFSTLDTALFTAQADYDRRILSALTADKPEQHPDDEAVDRFAAAMKAKLKWEREERGRYGWNDPEVCSEEYLAKLLIEHLAKGNDGNFEDVANICMMLHQRGAHPRVLADALTAGGGDE